MSPLRRAASIGAGATVALAVTGALAHAAAFHAARGGRCVPTTVNGSAVLPGTSLAVSPLPGSYDASTRTQISLLGAPVNMLGSVAVRGSRTGAHVGRLLGYSQGDGASFVPARPFSAGETVTVDGRVRTTGAPSHVFSYRFKVAMQSGVVYTPPASPPASPSSPSLGKRGEVQSFRSLPSLRAPIIDVTARSPGSAQGYVFAAPYSGHGQVGPMIFDESGALVWFDPLPNGTEATNLQVQQYGGRPVLTWWQGYIPAQGYGQGEEMIVDGSYRQIGRVHGGNGYKADLHDFHLLPGGRAVVTVFDPIACDLSAVGGPHAGTVTDSAFQEIDLKSGLVRSEWHSLDHVGLGDSYSSPVRASAQWPFDFFHVNSVDVRADGTTLISARNTSALYELSASTGQVVRRVGGKHSDVVVSPGAATAYQHDAETQANGTISIFDNGGVPKVHAQSRGLVVRIDPATRIETVLAQYEHPAALSSGSQGNVQTLADGDEFVGWGSEPYFSEFSAGGQLLFDAHMHGSYQSYRAYRFPWTGAPRSPPAIAAAPGGGGRASSGGAVTVYASWNGDTRTASWRVLAGPAANRLAVRATVARSGFETTIATPGPARYVAVQALDPGGAVLGVSPTIKG